jgi:hypothetical protein
MQKLLKQPVFHINNEAQLTNAFIKLVQAEVYMLEYRVKHESQNISSKKALKLRQKLVSEFKRKVNALSQHYLEQKANYYTYERIQEEKNTNPLFSEVSEQENFNQQLIF